MLEKEGVLVHLTTLGGYQPFHVFDEFHVKFFVPATIKQDFYIIDL